MQYRSRFHRIFLPLFHETLLTFHSYHGTIKTQLRVLFLLYTRSCVLSIQNMKFIVFYEVLP